jgi:hypothetical protein
MTACITSTTGAVTLWVAAIGLMVWDTIRPGPVGALAAWSLLVAGAAGVLTLYGAVHHARRVVLEVMTWEHWQMSCEAGDEVDLRNNVRAIRG